jgi:hypothetical protein
MVTKDSAGNLPGADTTKPLHRLDETALQQRPAIGTRVLKAKWISPHLVNTQ